jgi:hypothetical protein
MSDGAANQSPSICAVSQVAHQGGSIVDGAPSNVVEGLRPGRGDDRPASLGQRGEAHNAGEPGH